MSYRFLCFLIIFIAALLQAAVAQTYMKLNKTDGSVKQYTITEVSKITFSGQTLNVHKTDASSTATATTDIRKITFSGKTSGMSNPESGILNQLKSYPNPSWEQITFEYALTESTPVSIKIYSMNGELVKQLDKGLMPAGNYSFVWDALDDKGVHASAGTYLCNVITDTRLLSNKLILTK